MPVDEGIQWVFKALMLFGIFFWASVMLPFKAQPLMKQGWTWLQWRPFPGDLAAWMGLAFLVGLFLQASFFLLQGRLGGVFEETGVVILTSVILFQGFLSLMFFFRLHRVRLDVPQALGLENPLQLRDLVAGLVGFCMSLPLVFLSGLLTAALFETIGWDIAPQPILESFSELEGWLNWTTILLVAVFIVPLLEEVVFRGFVFSWLCQKVGCIAGVVLQAFLFALIHQHPTGFLAFFALAVVLGLAYVYTQRLMVCVWIHVFFNGMNLLILILTQGQGA